MIQTIFYGGRVVTMDGRVTEAVCVEDGRIAFTGSNEEALLMRSAGTKLVPLSGALMLPGFIDTHMHFLGYGKSLSIAQLGPARSKAELIETGRAFMAAHPGLRALIGAGWNNDHWSDDATFPTREQLDLITRDIPVAFTRTCYHIVCLNTRALEICGITENTPDPEGGSIYRDGNGTPTGVLSEDACSLAAPVYPDETADDFMGYLRASAADAVSCGLTTVHTDDLELDHGAPDLALKAYSSLLEGDWLPVRVYEQCRLANAVMQRDFFGAGYEFYQGDGRFRIGPMKLVADGSLGARTAYLKKPYCDAPETRGLAIYTQEQLDELIINAARHNMPSVVHAIGDAMLDMVLNSFEKARRVEETPLRHAVIHCQLTSPEQLARMAKLSIMAQTQPIFLDYDIHMAQQRAGELIKTSYAFNTMRGLGILEAFGSDCPVERFNAIQGIYHAVTRQDLSGFPEGGWYPNERMSVADAVACFTRDAAYTSYEENTKGTISAGKLADLVVLDSDIFSIEPADIKNAGVVMTVLGGKIVYEK